MCSSAACERVFSLLKLFFGDQQQSSLADLMQISLNALLQQAPCGLRPVGGVRSACGAVHYGLAHTSVSRAVHVMTTFPNAGSDAGVSVLLLVWL